MVPGDGRKLQGFFGEFWNVEVGDVNLDVPCFVWQQQQFVYVHNTAVVYIWIRSFQIF